MRRIALFALVLSTLLPLAHAQGAPAASLDDRRRTLNNLFAQYWDAALDHSPEFASEIGDTRSNNKLTDYSPGAQNAWTAREQDFLLKIASVDPAGFSPAEARAREDLLTQLTNDIEASGNRDWQTPVNEDGGIFTQYADLAEQLPFATVKDYDDWTARLHALPAAIDQAIANMGSGIDDHRVPAKPVLDAALAQIKQIAAAKPEDSPFATPLQHFPAAVAPADQERIQKATLDAITKQVLPAYQRLVRFFEVSYLPAAGSASPNQPQQPDSPALTLQSRKIEILTLRDKAEETLGPKFSLSAFHDAVSSYAIQPLNVLEDHVNSWIQSRK
jgi:uncharacterized protein (DUF885 family)